MVQKTVDTVLDNKNSPQQEVIALQDATKHPKIRVHCVSAGIVDSTDNVNSYIVSSIKEVIKLARKTNSKHGRQNNDCRLLLVQSLVIATLSSKNLQSDKKLPSNRQIADALGIPYRMYRRMIKSLRTKRASLQQDPSLDSTTIHFQVVKSVEPGISHSLYRLNMVGITNVIR